VAGPEWLERVKEAAIELGEAFCELYRLRKRLHQRRARTLRRQPRKDLPAAASTYDAVPAALARGSLREALGLVTMQRLVDSELALAARRLP